MVARQHWSLAIFCITILVASAGEVSKYGLDGQRRFPDRVGVEEWAAKESFGGHSIAQISWKSCEVLIVRRSFTSGVESCRLSVFVREKDAWVEALTLRPFWGTWLEVQHEDDSVRILTSRTKREILRFSIGALQVGEAID